MCRFYLLQKICRVFSQLWSPRDDCKQVIETNARSIINHCDVNNKNKKSVNDMVFLMDLFSPKKGNRCDNARTQGQQAPKVKPRRARPKGWLSTSCVPLPSNQPKKIGCDSARGQGRSARPHTTKVKTNAWARSAKCEKAQAPQGKIIKNTKVPTTWA